MSAPEESRDHWIRAAKGWEARADWFRAMTMPVSTWLVEALDPQPGATVLELAAGVGDVGFLAAELLEPGGTLITSDFAPEMLAAAQRRATQLGIANVRFRQMDANTALDQPAASLDGVLCRWGYMLLNDGEDALRETRRILKQDGRVALAVWRSAEHNQWSSAGTRVLAAHDLSAPSTGPGQFNWSEQGELGEHLAAAGFVDSRVEAVDFEMRYASVDDWWGAMTQMSAATAAIDARIDYATRSDVLADLERAAEPFLRPDDSLVIPAAAWVATATV
jgi:SAM-dependent methyltransferase